MTSQLDRECARTPKVTADFAYGRAKEEGWPDAYHNWRVTLRHQRRTLSVDFFGGAMVENPTVGDVLSSLILDADAGDQSFEDFCADFGYDTDSRQAERIWKLCRTQGPKVRQLLGDSFDRFARCEH